jgi:sensor domain CHASE-containing protein
VNTLQAPNTELLEEVRGAKLRRERIVNALIGAVVAIVANVIIWAYAQSIRVESQDANKLIIEKLDKQHENIKSLENELKVHAKIEDKKK